jgi:hypothetical protein
VDELQGDVDAEGGAVGDGGAEEDGGVEACSPVQGHIGTGRSSSSFTGAGRREMPTAELERVGGFLSIPRCSARSPFIRCQIDLPPSF